MKYETSKHVICIAEIKAKPGKVDELLQKLSKLVPLSKSEPGCLRYELHRNLEDPNIITFVDKFADMNAFEYHCETDYIKKYFDDIIPQLSEDIKISTYNEISF